MPEEPPFRAIDDGLAEGDILANVPFPAWRDGDWKPNPLRGIITSNGCAVEDFKRFLDDGKGDKARKVWLRVAPLNDPGGRPQDKLQKIRDGEVWRYFYVYGEAGTLLDQVVDLDKEQAMPASVLADLPQIARLAEWQWRRLLIHITVNRWGTPPEDIFGANRLDSLPAS